MVLLAAVLYTPYKHARRLDGSAQRGMVSYVWLV